MHNAGYNFFKEICKLLREIMQSVFKLALSVTLVQWCSFYWPPYRRCTFLCALVFGIVHNQGFINASRFQHYFWAASKFFFSQIHTSQTKSIVYFNNYVHHKEQRNYSRNKSACAFMVINRIKKIPRQTILSNCN